MFSSTRPVSVVVNGQWSTMVNVDTVAESDQTFLQYGQYDLEKIITLF